MKLAQRHPVKIHLDDGLGRINAGMLGERGSKHNQQVGLAHESAGNWCAASAQDAAPEGMEIANLPFRLERCQDGGVQLLG